MSVRGRVSTFAWLAAALLGAGCGGGAPVSSTPEAPGPAAAPDPAVAALPTLEEAEDRAAADITAENAAAELERLEQEIDAELGPDG